MQKRTICHVTLAALIATAPALAQQPAPATSAPAQPAPAPAAKTFSQQDLDTLLAPIALYPDTILAQILMAATYPLEIVEAARWAKANPGLKDKALQDALEKQKWDPSVKAIVAVPKVLEQMNEKLDWTQKLGDAFLAQQADIMATVQGLRSKAAAAGNLKSTPEVNVKTEQPAGKTVYVIESAKPEVVYVPTYNPSTIYGTWWYGVPPYYMYPPAYVYPPGLAFATGVFVGAAIWGNMNWGGNNVNINVNNYNRVNHNNQINSGNNNFKHNAEHRKGVAYQDKGVASQHGRGQSAQNRSDFQGRTGGQGGAQPRASNYGGGGGGGAGGGGGGASPRASTSNYGSRGGSGGGFEGVGNRSSTQAASSRGSASRGHGGGGGGGRRR